MSDNTAQPLAWEQWLGEMRALQHQLSNQLALIVGYAELLREDPRLPGVLVAPLNSALDAALAATSTLSGLQALTRPSQHHGRGNNDSTVYALNRLNG
jgi:hypothetical protein